MAYSDLILKEEEEKKKKKNISIEQLETAMPIHY